MKENGTIECILVGTAVCYMVSSLLFITPVHGNYKGFGFFSSSSSNCWICPQNFQRPSYDPWPTSRSMRNRSCTLSVRSAALTNLPSGSRMTNLSLPQLALDSHLMAASTALTLTLLSWMMRLSTRSLSMVLKALLRSWWKVNVKVHQMLLLFNFFLNSMSWTKNYKVNVSV